MSAGGTGSQSVSSFVEPGREAEFLTMLLEHLDVGVSVMDADMKYRLISRAVYDNLDITPDELKIGDSLSDCHRVMEDKGLLPKGLINQIGLSEGEQRSRTARGEQGGAGLLKLGDGSTHRHVRKPVGDGYTLSMATDVSDVVEKDTILESALFLGQAGYWTYEFATREYTLSKSFRSFLGKDITARVLKDGIIHCVVPEDRAKYKHALSTLKDGATRFVVEGRAMTAWGEQRWSQTVAELVRDPHGRPLRIRAFVRDTTDIRRKEAELERAKDEAVAANLAKSEFLANMSHEIRTPMNGVLGMVELLAAGDIDERQREYINVINSSATALLNIINDILDFSKIEAGALEIDPVAFDLRDCVADVTSLLVTSAQAKGLELIVDYPSDLPRHFIGDAGRIRQVLTNLVGNAIKFTEEGYVRIRVKVARKRGTAVVSLDVTDTGIGIAPTKLSRIFDKFTQADGSTTRVYGGTGLGLTITKRIVEMMRGRIKVDSTLGEGSTFTLRVPLPIDTDARVEAFDTASLAGRRVLVVDDIDVNCTVLRRQLAGWGMTADCAHDGVDAISALKRAAGEGTPYDLVLLDYLMPGVNGRELAAMIAKRDDLRVPPIIMLSSCDQPVSSQDLAAIGIDSYLVKPVRERRLYDTVVRVLSRQAKTARTETGLPKPVLVGTAAAPAPVALSEPAEPPKPKHPKHQDILVAEDFALNQDVVRLMLQGTPFNPVFAENGRVAVDMFTAEPDRFPLVLMDVSMPVMDGHMASREIRQWESAQDRAPVPIIALTGHAMKNDRQDCLDAGMDDFLTKPVKQTALLEKLEAFSGRAVVDTRAA